MVPTELVLPGFGGQDVCALRRKHSVSKKLAYGDLFCHTSIPPACAGGMEVYH